MEVSFSEKNESIEESKESLQRDGAPLGCGMAQIGKTNRLMIIRDSDHGYYLDGGELGDILLPNAEAPENIEQGEEIEVFLYRDSEDRLVATQKTPNCEADEFATLKVLDVNRKVGAFLDWGLPKDLLLPFKEQSSPVQEGQRVVVRVLLDPKSERIIATTKLGRYLDRTLPRYDRGEEVSILVIEKTPLGYTVMVNWKHRGLIHETEIHRTINPGDEFTAFVKEVREGSKVDISLNPVGYGRITGLSGQIFDALNANGGSLEVGDKSSPELIRQHFGTSKKAFKQAVGALYRKRKIKVNADSIELL